ncbi:hypothetical protein B9Z55_027072 [Caenorhabditis nigoni]|uniref:F-box domain-containing protein n=1 Tax=Caenorhabditis nigoni TaxID=1611254 RepID=A0A2G5SIS1_9PELO|nr:hypothetical protein B9Z55_027072 [Caenorhabditis nigoni]
MVNWSQLPPEIKRHVAKKLDFMSRHAMKSTSHSDRLIVNSTSFELPRVRFGYKGDRCLIVIYTGVEKFLRLEMIKEAHGITVLRSENSWDPKAISSKQLPPTSDLFKLGLLFLKSLLAEKLILIKIIEFEIDKNEKIFKNRISGIMGGAKFRINEIAANTVNVEFVEEFMNFLTIRKDLKILRNFDFHAFEENLGFQLVAEVSTMHGGESRLRYYKSMFYMNTVTPNTQNLSNDLLRNLVRDDENEGMKLAAAHILSPHIDEILPTVREENYSAIREHTKCGYSNFWMESKNEKALEKYTNLPCSLGNYCKDCGDPFEYWYYQNLPRRILHEPFWTDFISFYENGKTENVLRSKFRADENRKKQHLKNQKNPKNSKNSWGFGQISVEKLMEKMGNFNGKNTKNKKKKSRKLAEKVPEILEDSEDFQNSEDVEMSPEDSEVLENPDDVENAPEDLFSEDSELQTAPEDNLDDVKDSEISEDVRNSENSKILIFLLFPILGAFIFYWIFIEFFAF